MNNYQENKQVTASHLMLYVILLIYTLVVIYGIIFTTACIFKEDFTSGSQTLIALFSYAAICGSSTIVVYTNKAAKENEVKIANNTYKMKIDLAKEIYKSISNKDLDDKSLVLLKTLSDNSDTLESYIKPPDSSDVKISESPVTNNTSDEAFG